MSELPDVKLYGHDEDVWENDKALDWYAKHVEHMTSEKLHSKGAIAYELAYRDAEIEKLQAKILRLNEIRR